MMTEVVRERVPIASTLLVAMAVMLLASLWHLAGPSAASSSGHHIMSTSEMASVQGAGPISTWGGIAAVAMGVSLIAVAVVCVVNPVIGAMVVAGTVGSGVSVGVGAALIGFGGAGSTAVGYIGLRYSNYLP